MDWRSPSQIPATRGLHFIEEEEVWRIAVRDIPKTVECLDSCDWWSKPTAAERAIGAIDLSEEHHDIVRISARTVERFD